MKLQNLISFIYSIIQIYLYPVLYCTFARFFLTNLCMFNAQHTSLVSDWTRVEFIYLHIRKR
jgi:hypothetical protein